MQSKIITYMDKDRWNQFVAESAYGSILQSYEWGEFKAHFGWRPLRVVLEDDGKIIAGISILKREIPFTNHSLFYAPRGPIVDFSNKELLHTLFEAVEKEADRNHAISLKIDPELLEINNVALTNLRSLGFIKAAKQVQPRATLVLDLTPGLDELLKSFEEKTRYNIRLAERKGVSIKEDNSQNGIDTFFDIYQETAKRDHFMVHPLLYYRKAREVLFTAGLGSLFLAYYEGKPVAGVIVFIYGKKLWYMYGASANEYRNVMPSHLLHWEILKWAKARGLTEYDLWGIPANPVEGHPLYGVYRFKKGFNGRQQKYIGVYDFPYSHLFHYIMENGLHWWQNLRSLITKGRIEDSLSE